MYTPARDNLQRLSNVNGVRFLARWAAGLRMFSPASATVRFSDFLCSATPKFTSRCDSHSTTHVLTIGDCRRSAPEDALQAFDAM